MITGLANLLAADNVRRGKPARGVAGVHEDAAGGDQRRYVVGGVVGEQHHTVERGHLV